MKLMKALPPPELQTTPRGAAAPSPPSSADGVAEDLLQKVQALLQRNRNLLHLTGGQESALPRSGTLTYTTIQNCRQGKDKFGAGALALEPYLSNSEWHFLLRIAEIFGGKCGNCGKFEEKLWKS